MIGYSLRRSPGGRRYSSTDRTLARSLAAVGAPTNLTQAAIDAMVDPAGITAFVDVLFEITSNRVDQSDATVAIEVDGVAASLAIGSAALEALVDGKRNHVPASANPTMPAAEPTVEVSTDDVLFVATSPNAAAHTNAVAGVGSFYSDLTAVDGVIPRSTSVADPDRLILDRPNVFYVDPIAGTGYVTPTEFTPCRYLLPASRRRRFTVDVTIAVDGTLDVLLALQAGSGAMFLDRYADDVFTVDATDTVAGVPTRFTRTIDVDVPGADPIQYIRPVMWATVGTATRVEVVDLAVYAGEPRSRLSGVEAATTFQDVTVAVETVEPRMINRVEIHGPHWKQVTSASVDIFRDGAADWEHVAIVDGAGRLAADLGVEASVVGVRVHVEEISGGDLAVNQYDTSLELTEIDPMRILDISEDLESVELAWSRETDPGTTTNPTGSFQASTCAITIDDTSDAWNPAINTELDVGHRIEIAAGFRFVDPDTGNVVEEVLPGGVFYSEPFDTDSDSTTVTIQGVDRLGRNADVTPVLGVIEGASIAEILEVLAVAYLDLGSDQVQVDGTLAEQVLDYAFPAGNLGSFFADLAKATAGTLHIDALERLRLSPRTDVTLETVAEIRDDNALIRYRRPPGYDTTTSIVTVTASPLLEDADASLWTLPVATPIEVLAGETVEIVTPFSSAPATGVYLTGYADTAGGALTESLVEITSSSAVLRVTNSTGVDHDVTAAEVRGNPLVETPLAVTRRDELSVRRYGPRELTVDARLIQTFPLLVTVAEVLLDAYRSLDDDGVRRIPEVEIETLALMHVEGGDRVAVVDSRRGLTGEYAVLSRSLRYEQGGALLASGVRCRETSDTVWFVADESLTDDVAVAGY